jgi:hypothetical protein
MSGSVTPPPVPALPPGPGRAELRRTLSRVQRRVRLSRGRGAHALHALLAHVRGGDPLADAEEGRIATLLESLLFALEDAEAAGRRPRLPGR